MPLPSPQSSLLTSDYHATTVRRPTSYQPHHPVPSELGLPHATAPFLRTALLSTLLPLLPIPLHTVLPPAILEREKDQEKGARWRRRNGRTKGRVKKRLLRTRQDEASVFPSGDFGRFSRRRCSLSSHFPRPLSLSFCLYFLSFLPFHARYRYALFLSPLPL